MHQQAVTIALPTWTQQFLTTQHNIFQTIQQRMSFALKLADLNINNKSGGHIYNPTK